MPIAVRSARAVLQKPQTIITHRTKCFRRESRWLIAVSVSGMFDSHSVLSRSELFTSEYLFTPKVKQNQATLSPKKYLTEDREGSKGGELNHRGTEARRINDF